VEFSNQVDMSSIVPSNEVAEGKTNMEKTSLQFSQAQKLKIFMATCKSDEDRKT
jgi:hypothetical protein